MRFGFNYNGQQMTNYKPKDWSPQMKIKTICLFAILFTFTMANSTFAVTWTFQPRISGTQEYTSNVFLSNDNEEDDWITTVSAGFTAAAIGKTGELEVSYDPAFSFYQDFDENDGWSHDARLAGFSNLTKRTRFDISNKFLRTQDPLDDEDILVLRDNDVVQEGDTTVREGRRTYYRNTARTRLSYQFGKDDSVYAGFLYGLLRNSDSQEEDNDRYEPSAGLNYWFGPKFGFESNATYTKADFDRDSDFIGEGTSDFDNYAGSIRFIGRTGPRFSVFAQYNQIYRDYESNDFDDNDYLVYAPSAGLIYAVEKGLNLRLGAGYFYQDVENGDDEQGFFGNGQVDKTWTYRRGFINLTALTGLDQNNFGAENIGLERFAAIQGSARYDFLQNLSGDINGRYRYSDVVGRADEGGDENSGEKVHRYSAGAGLDFLPLKWMTIRLAYTFNKVNSENNEDEYDEHRGLLTVILTPSQPFRTK
jgi:hypothetical protein